MVVDGAREFVGSRGREARAVIEESARQMQMPIDLKATMGEHDGSLGLQISIPASTAEGNLKPGEVWLAVTESDLHSDVKAGENSGETLQHAPVVRALRKIGEVPAHDGEPANQYHAGKEVEKRKHCDRGFPRGKR
jgi:hypothetical protein